MYVAEALIALALKIMPSHHADATVWRLAVAGAAAEITLRLKTQINGDLT